jgi:hypothetical protein
MYYPVRSQILITCGRVKLTVWSGLVCPRSCQTHCGAGPRSSHRFTSLGGPAVVSNSPSGLASPRSCQTHCGAGPCSSHIFTSLGGPAVVSYSPSGLARPRACQTHCGAGPCSFAIMCGQSFSPLGGVSLWDGWVLYHHLLPH